MKKQNNTNTKTEEGKKNKLLLDNLNIVLGCRPYSHLVTKLNFDKIVGYALMSWRGGSIIGIPANEGDTT